MSECLHRQHLCRGAPPLSYAALPPLVARDPPQINNYFYILHLIHDINKLIISKYAIVLIIQEFLYFGMRITLKFDLELKGYTRNIINFHFK
jgi:hypothetical protein